MPSSSWAKSPKYTASPGACFPETAPRRRSELPCDGSDDSFPGQEHVAGNSKIPILIYYDKHSKMTAAGAEADTAAMADLAEDNCWLKAELCVIARRPY